MIKLLPLNLLLLVSVGGAIVVFDTPVVRHAFGKLESATERYENSISASVEDSDCDHVVGRYLATAYSLRGQTQSGVRARRGLIRADPRVLPLGSRVHLEAGAYSGEYFVGAEGNHGRGYTIEIWTPSSDEADRFGKRTVKVTILSKGWVRSPVMLRQDLERRYQENRISTSEYYSLYSHLSAEATEIYKSSARYYADNAQQYDSATFMPAKYGPEDPNDKDLLDLFYERLKVEIDLAKGTVTQAEHDERVAELIAEENRVAANGNHSPSSIARYYQKVARIPVMVGGLKSWNQSATSDTAFKIGTLLVALLGVALPFYLLRKKDDRERRLLEVENRKLTLAEVDSIETIEKTKLLFETKQG